MTSRHAGFVLPAALGVLLAALPAALPAAPYLVKDLNTSPAEALNGISLEPRGIVPGISYFVAADPAHGMELWRSDGTPGGTQRLTDICAGRCNSLSPAWLPPSITVHAGRVFFRANDGFSGDELWVSDGTPGSERRVRDLCPGPCSAVPGLVEEVGSRLLFVAHFPDKPERFELWQTDGTRDGTVQVKALCASDCTIASGLVPVGGEKALFLISTRTDELELWVTDGTANGTHPFRDLGIEIPLLPFAPNLVAGSGFAWVWASDGLWRTDGTAAGTFRLKQAGELFDGSVYFLSEVVWQGMLFGFSEGVMIRSDGTSEGTFQVMKLPDLLPTALVSLNEELLLEVDDSFGQSFLWSTRGTADTTGPKFALGGEALGSLTRLSGGRAVYLLKDPEGFSRVSLWVTDGTAAGTRQLLVTDGFLGYSKTLFSTGEGRVFLLAGLQEIDVWVTDGTEAGTQLARSFQESPGSSGPREQAALGGKLVFSARTTDWSSPLFVTDGTAAGTVLLSANAAQAFSLFRLGDRLFFSIHNDLYGNDPTWSTDGTPAGTALVTKRASLSHPALLGGQTLFAGDTRDTGNELWKTDGLARDVEPVKNIDPFSVDIDAGSAHVCVPESSNPVPAGIVGGRLLLAADDGRAGRELWASDGTPAGTVLLRDINPGRSPETPRPCEFESSGPSRHDIGLSSDPQGFVLLGSVLLFSADDGLRGRELWITNGTFSGTRRVADLVPGPRGSAPHDLVRFHDRVYFLAANPGLGESLWKTDGTARGTTRVRNLTLNGLPSWGRSLTVAGDRLFFTVYNETTGAELWTSTGNAADAASTGLVADLNPGPGNASPQSLTAIGGLLLFAADDGLTGLEPWRTDGTAAGTIRLGDIAPGRDASSPGPFTALDTVVITGADDGIHGREPWAIPRAEIVRPQG